MQYNKTCDNYLQQEKSRTSSNTPRIAMRTTRALLKEATIKPNGDLGTQADHHSYSASRPRPLHS